MKIKLLNRNEEWIKNIEVQNPKVTQEVNGEDVFEFETAEEVKKGYRLLFKHRNGEWKEYIVNDYEKIKSQSEKKYAVFAESSFYETLGDFVEEERIRNQTATVALTKALTPSRWEIGTVENLGLGTTTIYHVSVKEAVQQNILDTWQCEFKTRIHIAGNQITHRYVDLVKQIGNDTGKRFVYNKDMWEIKKQVSKDDIVTALYGYGKGEEVGDGFGRRITFESINNGKAYIEDNDAKLIYGRNGKNGKQHFFDVAMFDDVEDPAELKRLTEEELKKRNKPKISYTATVDDLSRYGFAHEGVGIGDRVLVIDKEDNLRLSARVLRYVDYLDDTESNEITLGNFKDNLASEYAKQVQFINKFREKQGIWDRANMFDKDGLNADFLKNLVEEMNIRMNNQGGYVYISDDGQGLITYDKPIDQNPTMAIQLVGGGFRIADGKKADGTWDWKTFGDGHGFVADLIVAGMLKGGKVTFNLSDGTLLIGNSVDDYSLWWDGAKLWIKGDGIDLTANDDYNGFKTQITQDAKAIKATAESAKSKAESALSADSYTRRIANTASDTASEAKQTADRVEIAFSNYSPDKIKYGTTYAITPSECYIAYNGTRKFSVSTSTGDVSTTGNFTSPYFIANSSGVTLKSKDGTTVLKPSQDRLEVWGLRTMNNVTMMGDIFMQGKAIYNGGLAIKFAYGTTYPIEMKQGVECFEGLYVHGSKNAILNTSTGYKGVTSYETAGYYFGDIGRGVIGNQVDDNGDGFILISIDGLFAEIVNTQVEYNVFLTKEGKGDIWVAEKDPSFFIIKGTPGLPFSYEIKAKRKNYENTRLDPHNIDTTSKVNDGNPFDMTNQDLTINDMFFESEVTI